MGNSNTKIPQKVSLLRGSNTRPCIASDTMLIIRISQKLKLLGSRSFIYLTLSTYQNSKPKPNSPNRTPPTLAIIETPSLGLQAGQTQTLTNLTQVEPTTLPKPLILPPPLPFSCCSRTFLGFARDQPNPTSSLFELLKPYLSSFNLFGLIYIET